jgi:hypothetical protein
MLGRVLPRASAWLFCLALPLVLVRHEAKKLAESWGTLAGRVAAEIIPPLFPKQEPVSAHEAVSLASFAQAEMAALAAPPAPRDKRNKARGKPQKPKENGVFVPASSVLRLANGGAAMPHAVLVPALGPRPAGLRLIGVSALGIGMRDGDVLTRVLGAEVSSVGEVVARVIAARNQRARQISGEFWRDGARWSLVVEQPYVDAPPPVPSAR